jgi:transposase-like protein
VDIKRCSVTRAALLRHPRRDTRAPRERHASGGGVLLARDFGERLDAIRADVVAPGLTSRRFAEEMKDAAVQRFLTSDLTLTAVAEQFGTTRYSIANWVQLAQSRSEVSPKSKRPSPQPAATTDARSAAEKLRLLVEAGALSQEQLGEFLQREGLRDGDAHLFDVDRRRLGVEGYGEVGAQHDHQGPTRAGRVHERIEQRFGAAHDGPDLPKAAGSMSGTPACTPSERS